MTKIADLSPCLNLKPGRGTSRAARARAPRPAFPRSPAPPPADQGLFEALRAWRREEAARQHVPPYVIFHDRTLAEIAAVKPTAASALSAVSGVGEGKLARYGEAVLAVVRGFEG